MPDVARATRIVMVGIVVVIAAATLVGLVLLWPGAAGATAGAAAGADDSSGQSGTGQSGTGQSGSGQSGDSSAGAAQPGGALAKATIVSVDASKCADQPADGCAKARATVDRQEKSLYLASEAVATHPAPGDRIKVAQGGSPGTVVFVDYDRNVPMGALAVLCAIVVVAVAWFKGMRALIGLLFAFAVIVVFMLPALLAGKPAVAVGLVAAALIMLVVMYLTHGAGLATTTAFLGTACGIAIIVGLAVAVNAWGHLAGLFSDDIYILATTDGLDPGGIVVCSILVAGLGALNDVTITQVSAVAELRAASPRLRPARAFAAAMRIGRDHIASSVYTVAFVLVGGALATLLVLDTSGRPILQQLTLGDQAVEIASILVCLVGLVAAVPVTTAIAVAALRPRGLPGH